MPAGKHDLTGKQEKFCQEYIKHRIAAEAYRAAGYKCDAMSDNALYVEAHRVLTNPKVSLRLDELMAQSAKRNEIDVDFVAQKLLTALSMAEGQEDSRNMRGAAMDLAKLHGLVIEKRETTMKDDEIKESQKRVAERFVERNKDGSLH